MYAQKIDCQANALIIVFNVLQKMFTVCSKCNDQNSGSKGHVTKCNRIGQRAGMAQGVSHELNHRSRESDIKST